MSCPPILFLLTLCNLQIVELPHFGTSFYSFISLHICLRNEYINNSSSTSSTYKWLMIWSIRVALQASNIAFKIFLQFLVKLYEWNVIKLCLKGGACWLWQTRGTIHNVEEVWGMNCVSTRLEMNQIGPTK